MTWLARSTDKQNAIRNEGVVRLSGKREDLTTVSFARFFLGPVIQVLNVEGDDPVETFQITTSGSPEDGSWRAKSGGVQMHLWRGGGGIGVPGNNPESQLQLEAWKTSWLSVCEQKLGF